MKPNERYILMTVMLCCIVTLAAGLLSGQTTAYTYQGKLADGGAPGNGNYDFQFTLWDAVTVGTQLGSLTQNGVSVTGGIFTVALDFGSSSFPGANRFLEIRVRPAGTGTFSTLAPRQSILSTPYSIRSLNATTADG